jgi:hypothetical protein
VIDYGIGEREEWYHLQIVLRKRRGGKEQEMNGVGNTDEKGYFWRFLEFSDKRDKHVVQRN